MVPWAHPQVPQFPQFPQLVSWLTYSKQKTEVFLCKRLVLYLTCSAWKPLLFKPALGMFQHWKCGLEYLAHPARGDCRGVIWNTLAYNQYILMVCTHFCPQRDLVNAIFSGKTCFLWFIRKDGNTQINRICYVNRQSDFLIFLFTSWLGGWGGSSGRIIKCCMSPLFIF